MAKAEEGFAAGRAERIVVHGAKRDALPPFAGEGIVAQQEHLVSRRDPRQGEREEPPPDLVQAPLRTGEEAVEGRDVLGLNRPGGQHDRGHGAPSQAVDPAGQQHGEVGVAGRVKAGAEGGREREERVR
jgi:hypothetical protein